MSSSYRLAALCLLAVLGAVARSQELEPGVQTSSAAAATGRQRAPGSAPSAPQAKPASVPAARATSGAGTERSPVRSAAGTNSTAADSAATASAKTDKAIEHVDLDATQISGNRELPKVMYVVPWRRADLGEFAGRPPNSLLEEALTPVDRDVFRRQNRYYDALQSQAASARSQPGAAGAGSAPPVAKDEK